MKIAVLGSGGREHALAWRLGLDVGPDNVLCIPGNGGTPNNAQVDATNFAELEGFCEEQGVELLVVGPEAPLADGLADYFLAVQSPVRIFGPAAAAARLESSKVWAKEFMHRHGVATAESWTFGSPLDPAARKRVEELDGVCVIKYDGLAAGKGVVVCGGIPEAAATLEEFAAKYGRDAAIVIEERLVGVELSILGFTDGRHIQLLPPSQDHKQLLDGDRGPNTGGMGAFTPVDFCDPARLVHIVESIVNPTLAGLSLEEIPYCGVIYFGLMFTATGPRVLEYNVRLGDPEAEVLLPAIESSLVELMLACLDGTLDEHELEVREGSFVDVVMAAPGYPKSYPKGMEISGLDDLGEDVLVFHAGTRRDGERVVTAGGRVLNVVAWGEDLEAAIAKAYAACDRIHFEGKTLRRDIGRRENRL